MIFSQSELHQLLSSSSPAIEDFPPSAELLTPMLQMLHILGAVQYAQRSGTVCIRPTLLPKVSCLVQSIVRKKLTIHAVQIMSCFVLSAEHNRRRYGVLEPPPAILSRTEARTRLCQTMH